ncbi:MAG: hypothetical protein ABSF83_03260 [Nitrososphaerales archaeon]
MIKIRRGRNYMMRVSSAEASPFGARKGTVSLRSMIYAELFQELEKIGLPVVDIVEAFIRP